MEKKNLTATTDELARKLDAVKNEMIEKCNELARKLDPEGETDIDISDLDICEGDISPITLITPLPDCDVDCLLQCVGEELYISELSASAVCKIMQHLQHLLENRKRYAVNFTAKDCDNIELKGEIVVEASGEKEAEERARDYLNVRFSDTFVEVSTSIKEVK